MATPNFSIEHELSELADQIHNLFFLSGGNCTQAQLDTYAEQLTQLFRKAKALGYHAHIVCTAGGIGIEWQPLHRGAK
jgi:hypothetical protein